MCSCSHWVSQCAIASCNWKEDAFSQLFKREERKLYSANQLLTLNYSLSSMAQSLLPQFSVLYMKHKISFLSSKPFLIENGEMDEVRIGPYKVESFSKECIVLQFYSFKILFYSSWIERETCQWYKGGEEWPCSFSVMEGSTWMHISTAKHSYLVPWSQYKLLALLVACLQELDKTQQCGQRIEQKPVRHLDQPMQRFYWLIHC